MEIVKLKNVTYRYPTAEENSLNGISMTLEKGKVYAMVGENGGGKSTICSLIKGFIPHIFYGDLSGEIEIFGNNIYESSVSDFVKTVGYVSQNPFSQITGTTETVFEEIAYGLENLGVPEEVIIQKVEDVLKLLGISHLATSNPTRLSGGQKQRVAIASIYVMEPELFILDEPTSQLDPVGTMEIFSIISLLKSQGKTVLLVENKIELVAQYADKILLVKDGRIVDEGTPEDLLVKKSTEEYGSFIPQYTLLGLQLKEAGFNISKFPVLEEYAINMINELKDN